jgi:hypothetical protein
LDDSLSEAIGIDKNENIVENGWKTREKSRPGSTHISTGI